jgi:DNA helicase-2/ATP-dependent DNA helicase PcrA
MFKPRPLQQEVLNYQGGMLGVSAVPGSGKTHTLSCLAANLIADGRIRDDQEVLIVTLVNSAVDNFSRRVAGFVAERGLLPHVGYRVRTLHGLAHDVVRERPSLAGLSDDFQIIDEATSAQILHDAVNAWIHAHPGAADEWVDLENIEERSRYRVMTKDWPDLVGGVAGSFIRLSKDLQVTPGALRDLFERSAPGLPLVEMGLEVYSDYQRALIYRGAVDFDDLIRLALLALKSDPDYLARLRDRWPYILEDEAQDSSRLQEEILRLLAGDDGNWVRVGDPNQAIYETFTTANPRFLLDFLKEDGVQDRALPNSGRSTASIIRLANHLIDWTRDQHPLEELRGALNLPYIEPAPSGDPQPNPPDNPSAIYLNRRKYAPEEELSKVADSVQQWLRDHPDQTLAVLVPRNERGAEMVEELKQRKIEYIEILKSTHSTRQSARRLSDILASLARPDEPKGLAEAFKACQPLEMTVDETGHDLVDRCARYLRKCARVEDYLWPRLEHDWLAETGLEHSDQPAYALLIRFRDLQRRWQAASILPIDQLVLTIAMDLFDQPPDLALAHKLAGILLRLNQEHPEWSLTELSRELDAVARNQRKLLGMSEEDTGFDPDQHRGKAVVATMHKAKGLEWDRVYLLSVNSYDFPSGMEGDNYISEKWFLRDRLNLEAEALSQLSALLADDPVGYNLAPGEATRQARLDYAAERLRLFYVGITRARRELVATWNSGRRGDQRQALPFVALQAFWEKEMHERETPA